MRLFRLTVIISGEQRSVVPAATTEVCPAAGIFQAQSSRSVRLHEAREFRRRMRTFCPHLWIFAVS